MESPENADEAKLIARSKKGNIEAFELLVKKYQKSIYYLCYRMTGTHQAADDISQESFIKAYFSISQFKEGKKFFSWIRKIAVNACLNHLKTRKRETLLDETILASGDNFSTHQDMPLDKVQKDSLERKFRTSLETLSPEQKSVFILKVFEGLSYEDISRILTIPRGTVMSRLNRARAKLKNLLANYL
ncbi:RNA polymerase sigma factor [Acidobacteriota bacterium]